MFRSGVSRLLVADGNRLLGIVSQSDIMRFLAVKLDLEGDDDPADKQVIKSTSEHLARESR